MTTEISAKTSGLHMYSNGQMDEQENSSVGME
jgi:hypothetical protein